jgi:hypothetical protein
VNACFFHCETERRAKHAVSEGAKRKSVRPPARIAQQGDHPVPDVLEDDAEAIARKAVDMAKAGDIAAIRICMDRLAPARRNDAIVFELPPIERATDTVVAAATIVTAVAAGDLAPSEAADLAKVIDIYLRALATGSFEERLAQLESAAETCPAPAATRRTPITPIGGSDG